MALKMLCVSFQTAFRKSARPLNNPLGNLLLGRGGFLFFEDKGGNVCCHWDACLIMNNYGDL